MEKVEVPPGTVVARCMGGAHCNHTPGTCTATAIPATVDSASDDRTANNAVRHAYRVLSDEEKAAMVEVKDQGAKLLAVLDSLYHRTPEHTRCIPIARQKVEEAVMWAVKGITA